MVKKLFNKFYFFYEKQSVFVRLLLGFAVGIGAIVGAVLAVLLFIAICRLLGWWVLLAIPAGVAFGVLEKVREEKAEELKKAEERKKRGY